MNWNIFTWKETSTSFIYIMSHHPVSVAAKGSKSKISPGKFAQSISLTETARIALAGYTAFSIVDLGMFRATLLGKKNANYRKSSSWDYMFCFQEKKSGVEV